MRAATAWSRRNRNYVAHGEFEPAIENLFAHPEIDYPQVHNTTAGCFTFRTERAAEATKSSPKSRFRKLAN
jgi:uncharacterized protein DUF1203